MEYDWLCENPNLPMGFVVDHPEGIYCMNDQGELVLTEWRWYILTDRKDLDWNFVRGHPNLPWNWSALSRRDDLSWDLIVELPDKPWDWDILSGRDNLDWNLVKEHPELPWRWDILSNRDDLKWSLVKKLSDKPWRRDIRVKPLQEVMLELDDWTSQELSRLAFNGYLPGSKTKSTKR